MVFDKFRGALVRTDVASTWGEHRGDLDCDRKCEARRETSRPTQRESLDEGSVDARACVEAIRPTNQTVPSGVQRVQDSEGEPFVPLTCVRTGSEVCTCVVS